MLKTMKSVFVSVAFTGALSAAQAAVNLPDFTPLVDDVDPIVTSISTEMKQGHGNRQGASGSGFVISSDGYVLTNHHVVNDADIINVRLSDGKLLTAKKIGDDEESDIALLKIDATGLKAAKIGDVSKLRAGAWVVAFGAPFGFEHTVTAGIVSAKGRSLQWSRYVPFIQSDVAINPGNSGGPLVNVNGEVVGINSQILSSNGGSIGMSFSIPIDLAMDVVQQLKAGGTIKRGFLGVGYQAVEDDVAMSFGLDRARGALVRDVGKGSPAEKAGIKVGDVITKFDDVTVETFSDLPIMVGRTRPGKTVKVEIYRDGKPKVLSVVLADQKDGEGKITSGGSDGAGSGKKLGLNVGDLNRQERTEAGIDHGIVVRGVEEGPAADAGIRPGDVIVSIDRVDVTSVAEFRDLVKKLKPGRSVPVFVMRNGVGQFIVLRIPE